MSDHRRPRCARSPAPVVRTRGRAGRWAAGSLAAALLLCASGAAAERPSPEDRAWLSQHPVLRVGLETDYAPFSFTGADGLPAGISVEYLRLLERQLGVRFEVAATGDLGSLLERTRRGELDLLTSLTRTPERAAFLAFTEPYFVSPAVLVVRQDHPGPQRIEALGGARVATGRGYGVTEHLRREHPDLRLVEVPNDAAALRVLLSRGADAAVVDLASLSWIVNSTGLQGLRVLDDEGFRYALSLAARADLPQLQRLLDDGLRALPPAEVRRIRDAWVRVEVASGVERSRLWRALAGLVGAAALLGIVVLGVNWALRREVGRRTRELARSERRYRLLADHVRDVIWTLDLASGRFTYVSPSIRQLRGLTPEEALQERIEESLTPESLARARAAMARIGTPEEEDPHTGVYDLTCRGGAVKHVEITTSIIRERGRPTQLVGVSRDVTSRVQADAGREAALRALSSEQDRFRAFIERSSDLTLVLDDRERIAFASPAARALLGVEPAELVGRPGREFVHPDDAARVGAIFQALLGQPPDPVPFEIRLRRADGSWALLEAQARSMFEVPGVQGIVVNHRDVTERNRLRDQVQQAQRLEGLGRLAGGVAHDFNNLLTVILSCTEALEASLAGGGAADPEDVAEIREAGERARDLTRQLLAFARRQVIAPVPLDLNGALRASERLLRRVLGEDVLLVTRLEPSPWAVRCDPGQIEQVMLNLAVNARDAMPTGGRLEVATSNVEAGEAERRRHPDLPPGPYVRLSVADTGTGMSPEVQRQIFEPFFTTKAAGRGTGLGLATVYGIVKQSQGSIAVESEPGRGTTFEILLPRSAEPAAPGRTPVPARGGRGEETILVVEDEAAVREAVARGLRAAGFQVLAAADGRGAREALARAPGRVDLLLSDVVLPGVGGRELAEQLVRARPGLRVLLMSGHVPGADDRAGIAEASAPFIQKPFTGQALANRVREVLDGA